MVAERDHYGVWTGGTWTHQEPKYGIELDGVSCSSAKFCLGFDKTETAIWNGTAWSPGASLPTSTSIDDVLNLAGAYASCPVDGWCMVTMPGPVVFTDSARS